MKDKIRLLPQKVANQIAAGEVVTHPASVIKEMMENSIDAGATEVIVNYRKGGYELIQIVDNGVGMSPNDARMAFERHATSKIRKANDLYDLGTFGFRGEALASIAAVSKVELKSCVEGAEMGTLTIVENGDCVDQRPEMCQKGSQFLVKDIFHDTPARLRFQSSDAKGATQMRREFRRVALCYPDKSFELYGDGAPLYRLSPTTLLSRIVDVVGRSAKSTLLDIKAETSIVKIEGFIGNEKSARKRNSDQYMFVNGRYFESKYLRSAIYKVYEKVIKTTLHPSFFIYFTVPKDSVDVNIHPQKIEIKFAEEESIWTILHAAVREAFARTGTISMMEFDNHSGIEIPIAEPGKIYAEPRAITNDSYNPFEIEQEIEAKHPRDEFEARAEEESNGEILVEYEDFESSHTPSIVEPRSTKSYAPTPARSSARRSPAAMSQRENMDLSWESDFEMIESSINGESVESVESVESEVSYDEYESIGESGGFIIEEEPQRAAELPLVEPKERLSQSIEMSGVTVTNGRYAWCKIEGSMTVIDLKRAKERVLYELYCSTISNNECVSQRILFPLMEQLTAADYTTLQQNMDEFRRAGFEITPLSDNSIEISGVPAGVKDEVVMELIEEILTLLSTPEDVAESRRESIAAVMAQNGSKSIGKNISTQQATELVTQLMSCKHNGRTADGRRVMWAITPEDIHRRLK